MTTLVVPSGFVKTLTRSEESLVISANTGTFISRSPEHRINLFKADRIVFLRLSVIPTVTYVCTYVTTPNPKKRNGVLPQKSQDNLAQRRTACHWYLACGMGYGGGTQRNTRNTGEYEESYARPVRYRVRCSICSSCSAVSLRFTPGTPPVENVSPS